MADHGVDVIFAGNFQGGTFKKTLKPPDAPPRAPARLEGLLARLKRNEIELIRGVRIHAQGGKTRPRAGRRWDNRLLRQTKSFEEIFRGALDRTGRGCRKLKALRPSAPASAL